MASHGFLHVKLHPSMPQIMLEISTAVSILDVSISARNFALSARSLSQSMTGLCSLQWLDIGEPSTAKLVRDQFQFIVLLGFE